MKKVFFIIAISFISYSCSTSKSNKNIDECFEDLKKDNSGLLNFFKEMPKGGDIHHHASGSGYAESYIKNAIKKNLYIDTNTYQLYSAENYKKNKNNISFVLINDLLKSKPEEKDSIIDYWSVRNYKKQNRSGHDWFFNTFPKFGPAIVGNEVDLLNEICERAKEENISYIETMIDVENLQDSIKNFVQSTNWPIEDLTNELKLNIWFQKFEDGGINRWAKENADSMDAFILRTDNQDVKLKFLTHSIRILTSQSLIFGQILLGFKTALLTDNLLGVNIVAPEDNQLALQNYKDHMGMYKFLHNKYPSVNITLHAGELVLGKGETKKEDLTFHIYEALNTGRAQRIGHGVDLNFENKKEEIIKFMKDKGYAVEINLESNEVILETNTNTHPIKDYYSAGVPITISTDDAGVLRTNLTNQYLLLVKYLPEITYSEIKSIVQNSIKYSFLEKEEKEKLIVDLENRFEKFESKLTFN